MPKPPAARTLGQMGRNTRVVPFFLQGNAEKHVDGSSRKLDFTSEGQFAVGIGPLSVLDTKNYDTIYGEGIFVTVARILLVLNAIYYQRNPDKKPASVQIDVTVDPVTGNFVTKAYGPMNNDLETSMCEVFAYVASCRGKVIGYKDGSMVDFVYEPLDVEDVLRILQPGDIYTQDATDGAMLFYEMLQLANLYNPEAVEQAVAPTRTTEEEEELKNSSLQSEKDSEDNST